MNRAERDAAKSRAVARGDHYASFMIPAKPVIQFCWLLVLVATCVARAGQDAAQQAQPDANQFDSNRAMVESLPLVAAPMGASEVERLFTDVGLLPIAEPHRAAFDKALAAAIATATASRAVVDEGEYKRLVGALASSITMDGNAASGQIAMVKAVRANALAIEFTLLDAAARAASNHVDDREKRLRWAQSMRRADVAAQTLPAGGTLAIPFLTVTAAFPATANLTGENATRARELILADSAARAEITEQLSLALLEGGPLFARNIMHEMQVELATALAKGVAVEPSTLEQIALALAARSAFAPAGELARLDAMLVQSIATTLSPALAFDIASRLESSSPSATLISGRMMRIPQFARDALALPTLTADQSKALTTALAEWQSADLTSYTAMLQGDGELMSAAAVFAKSINPNDSQSWQVGAASPTSQRFTQQSAKRVERVTARRALAKSTREKFEAILGAELWKSIAPSMPARASQPEQAQDAASGKK